MQDELYEFEETADSGDYEAVFVCLERDARRYNRAFGEEEEAKRI